MALTPLPTAPQRTDSPDVFDTRADALVAALPNMVTEINALTSTLDAVKVADATHAATAQTLADADEIGFWRSVSGLWSKITWANLEAAFDARYSRDTEFFPLTVPAPSSGALTSTLAACATTYRNATVATGTPVTVATTADTTGTIPATSSLGVATGASGHIYQLEFYNGGTPVIGWVNAACGLQLDERNLVSPTTIGAASTSATTIYSASSVSANSPYRIIGDFDAVWTSGVGWSTPTNVQPAGGVAITRTLRPDFTSSGQTITAGGALTIAHGLGQIPSLLDFHLVALAAVGGYSIGDILPWNFTRSDQGADVGKGVVITPDATNLNIRFGSYTYPFHTINKSTGANVMIAPSDWNIVFKAWR